MQRYNKIFHLLLIFFLSAIAVVGVLLTPVLSEYDGRDWLFDLFVSRRLSCLIYWTLFCLLVFLWKKRIHSVSWASVIPAVLFSVISVAEGCLEDPVTLYCPSRKALVLAFVGCLVLFVLLLELIYWGIDTILSSHRRLSHQNKAVYNDSHRRSKTVVYGCCILLLWSPWMIMCFPGNMNSDTGSSILFHLGLDRSNVNNPFFQNFIFGMVYRLGRFLGNVDIGVFLYALCQSTLIAMTLGTSLSHLESWGAPKAWVITLIALYGLCPYFPIFAITLGKDSNFTVVVLMFANLLTICMSQGREFLNDWKKVIILSGLIIMMGLLRNHGALIGVGCLVVCGIRYAKETKRFPKMLGIAIAAILMITSFLPSALGVPKTMTRESMSIPLQQTARYVINHGDEVTPEEWETIDAVIPCEKLYKYYPVLADPVKEHVRSEISEAEWFSYLRVWLKHMLAHPKTYLEAFYFQTYGYYSTEAISEAKPMRRWGYHVSDAGCEMTEIKQSHNPEKLQLAKSVDEWAMSIPLLGKFQRIGIYTWILIASIAYLISRKRTWMLICLLPSIVIMAGCCLSPVNGYPRYALSAAVMIPIMASNAFFISNEE